MKKEDRLRCAMFGSATPVLDTQKSSRNSCFTCKYVYCGMATLSNVHRGNKAFTLLFIQVGLNQKNQWHQIVTQWKAVLVSCSSVGDRLLSKGCLVSWSSFCLQHVELVSLLFHHGCQEICSAYFWKVWKITKIGPRCHETLLSNLKAA